MSLPLELLLAIARLLPQNALPAFARTSSALADLAQRALYRHLTPTHRTLVLVPLLARRPHIARHVRSFHLALDPAAPLFASFYTLLANALHNMSDLHSLHLLLDPSATWVLRNAAPAHLVHFTATFPLDDNVARFLHRTPALRELELDSTIDSPSSPLPETCIPRLEQFIGSSCAASLIVPGRPVSKVHLNESTLSEDHIPLLARSSAQVLVLEAITNTFPVPFLHLVHHHLPHLAYLRVTCTHHLCHSPEFYQEVANVLGLFSQLSAFELSGIHWGSQRIPDDDSKRVWQSSPLFCSTLPSHDLLFPPDFFLAS